MNLSINESDRLLVELVNQYQCENHYSVYGPYRANERPSYAVWVDRLIDGQNYEDQWDKMISLIERELELRRCRHFKLEDVHNGTRIFLANGIATVFCPGGFKKNDTKVTLMCDDGYKMQVEVKQLCKCFKFQTISNF